MAMDNNTNDVKDFLSLEVEKENIFIIRFKKTKNAGAKKSQQMIMRDLANRMMKTKENFIISKNNKSWLFGYLKEKDCYNLAIVE